MRFRHRNLFYLRLSANDVIPLYVYLDERHIDWMSQRTLQSVATDLRPLIGPMLEAEQNAYRGPSGSANAKRGTLETYRGDYYHFGYFLRKVVPHAVVVKSRDYIMVNRSPQNENSPSIENQMAPVSPGKTAKGTKRSRKKTVLQKKTSRKGKGKMRVEDIIEIESSEEEAEESIPTDTEDEWGDTVETPSVGPGRSTRRKKPRMAYGEISDEENDNADNNNGVIDEEGMTVNDKGDIRVKEEATNDDQDVRDEAMDKPVRDDPNPFIPPNFGIDEDEEYKKLKPELQLSFRRLTMQDRCLCVIVQPLPSPTQVQPSSDRRLGQRGPSMAPDRSASRAPSITRSRFSVGPKTEAGREQTPMPLFLPSPTGRDRSTTPAPVRFPSEFSNLETMEDTGDALEEEDEFNMLAFSQAVSRVSGSGIGATEEDDDMDGGALYGDADEIRGAFQ